MKNFNDLEFGPHSMGGLQAKIFFENGYGVSVVRFSGSYTRTETQWELAVLKGVPGDWDLTYDTPITEDVIGYLQADEVTEIMKQVQELPTAI